MAGEHGGEANRRSRSSRGGPQLDEVDAEIITQLQEDGRKSFKAIADTLGLSLGTIRNRVQRLEESGILQIVGIADPLKVGFDILAMIGIHVAAGHTETVSVSLAEMQETSYVATTAGRYDLFAEMICRDTAHFRAVLERIQATEGVIRTESHLITGIKKMAYGWSVHAQR